MLTRIIEPASKQDSLRVPGETGIDPPSYPTVNRRLPVYSRPEPIVFAALAISRWIEDRTGSSIKKFVKTSRWYRTVHIKVGDHTITAAEPRGDLRDATKQIRHREAAH